MVIKPSAANQSGVHNTGGQIHSWRLDKRGGHLTPQRYGIRRKSRSCLGILSRPPVGLGGVEAFAEKWKHHGGLSPCSMLCSTLSIHQWKDWRLPKTHVTGVVKQHTGHGAVCWSHIGSYITRLYLLWLSGFQWLLKLRKQHLMTIRHTGGPWIEDSCTRAKCYTSCFFPDELQRETIDIFSLRSKVKAIFTVHHLREMMTIWKPLDRQQRKLAKN